MMYTILNICIDMWIFIFICFLLLIIVRTYILLSKNLKYTFFKELFIYIFICYLMCLFYVVTFKDADVPVLGFNIIPFKEMFRYPIGSIAFIKNVLGNMIMFVPLGFFIPYISKKSKVIWIIIITFIISLTIEFVQSRIGRIFDIDDIILNIIGGVIGGYMYILKNSLHKKIDFDK